MPDCYSRLRKFVLLSCSLLLFSHVATAQNRIAKPTTHKVYTYVEQMPQLPGGGGPEAIVSAIQRHVTYPSRALLAQVEGRIFVNFVVNPDGRVEKIKILKGLVSDCDSVVVQAVKQLPRFSPGRLKGQAVWVQFTVPVTFRIED